MDNRKGFITLEVILIIFILGLVSRNILPMFYTNIKFNEEIIKKNQKVDIYDSIIETMKISKKNNKNIGPHNIDFIEMFERFKLNNYYSQDFEILVEKEHYVIKIEKENHNKFWKIKLQVSNKRKDISYEENVEFLLQK